MPNVLLVTKSAATEDLLGKAIESAHSMAWPYYRSNYPPNSFHPDGISYDMEVLFQLKDVEAQEKIIIRYTGILFVLGRMLHGIESLKYRNSTATLWESRWAGVLPDAKYARASVMCLCEAITRAATHSSSARQHGLLVRGADNCREPSSRTTYRCDFTNVFGHGSYHMNEKVLTDDGKLIYAGSAAGAMSF